MTVLDALAVVALLLDEPAAEEVDRTLREGACSITAANLAEALDVLGRRHGVEDGVIRSALDPLLASSVRVVAQGEPAARRAAQLRRRHYDRRSAPLSLADCLLLAEAGHGDRIATADAAVARAGRAEGIVIVALPDSAGTRP